jgi:GMP synthase-like glutamine amidotransferase
MEPRVALVVSEHRAHITPEALARYTRFAALLEELTGGPCPLSHHLDPLPAAERLVLSGSYAPWAVHDPAELDDFGARLLADDRPALGVCAGMQLLARFAGGRHDHMADPAGEHGFATVDVVASHPALRGLPERWEVFQHHDDEVAELPPSLQLVASNSASAVQAFIGRERSWWGMQFHPESYDEAHPDGRALLGAFLTRT